MFDKAGTVFRKVQNLKIEIYLVTAPTLVAFAGTLVGFTAECRSSSRQFLWSDSPEYAASGIVDYVDDYLIDDTVLLISEDGANLKSRVTPIAFTAQGKIWVNNHAHILKFENIQLHKLVELYLNHLDLTAYITGMAQPKLSQNNLNRIKVPVPPLTEQKRLVAKVEKLEKQIAEAQAVITAAPARKQAIMQKYL